MNILITGGSGFIGTKLAQVLLVKGHHVTILDRVPLHLKDERLQFEQIDLAMQSFSQKYDGTIDAIVHLAGKPIFGRWTSDFKKEIYDSRILSTRNIVNALATWKKKPEVLVTASAFGFYGDSGEENVDELHAPGTDFLAQVCADWELEARKAEAYGIRTVQIRTAHVLGQKGILAPLFTPFKLGFGAWFGKGCAWFPWIHVDDIVQVYLFAIESSELHGPVNAAAPEEIRQKAFMKQFARALKRRAFFSIPIPFLRMRYGAFADTFNNSVRMSTRKLQKAGFIFKHPNLQEALESIVRESNFPNGG